MISYNSYNLLCSIFINSQIDYLLFKKFYDFLGGNRKFPSNFKPFNCLGLGLDISMGIILLDDNCFGFGISMGITLLGDN